MAYKRIDFRREWYTKGWILDGSGIQKDRFFAGLVYKRTDLRREWYTRTGFTRGWYAKGLIFDRNNIYKRFRLDGSGMQEDSFWMILHTK